ncbi:PH domain-containing protein [Pedobacter sp. L105]|uniref:PH domain-containing protein n=1 Tax=Pedobacter sp. L105 TaxID=1641871 RepID=UPI00131AE482|nr:PH domain-containing protein [Pedobacter sp. L105]
MKFTASRLSEGNKVFPTEITLEENSIEIKTPGLFSGDSKYINYEDITSIEVESPMIGFATLRLFVAGNRIEVHGFSKGDIKEIRKIIDENRTKRRRII